MKRKRQRLTKQERSGFHAAKKNERNHGWDTDIRSDDDDGLIKPENMRKRKSDDHLVAPDREDAHE